MKDLLSPEARPVLDEVARGKMLLAFDFDGTLAPLVEEREAARMRGSTATLLRQASRLYPCAVVSGRARSDVARRVEGIPLFAIVGNHGAEAGSGPVDRSVRSAVAGWLEAARAALGAVPGVEVEDKGLSLAIHYRRAPSPARAEEAARAAAAAMPGARVLRGHAVVNVVLPDQDDKGRAVARLVARSGAAHALYVGDDMTDEDAFRDPSVAVSVRVGPSSDSAAAYSIASQGEIDALLRALVALGAHE